MRSQHTAADRSDALCLSIGDIQTMLNKLRSASGALSKDAVNARSDVSSKTEPSYISGQLKPEQHDAWTSWWKGGGSCGSELAHQGENSEPQKASTLPMQHGISREPKLTRQHKTESSKDNRAQADAWSLFD